jgi:hypothetical protein
MDFLATLLNSKFLANILIPITIIVYLIQKIFNTILGLLFLSLIIQLLSPYLFNIEPYSFEQLVLWYSDLDIGFKSSVISSLITILGFLIVFQGSHAMWRKEVTTNIRIKASEEFSELFQDLQDCIYEMLSYSSDMQSAHNLIKENANRSEIETEVVYAAKGVSSFIESRSEFLYLNKKLITLRSRYSHELNSFLNGHKQTQKVSDLLTSLISYLYPKMPYINAENPSFINSFSRSTDIEEWSKIEQKLNISSSLLFGPQALVTSGLKNPILLMNFGTVLSLLRNRNILEEIINNMDYKKIDSEIKKNRG